MSTLCCTADEIIIIVTQHYKQASSFHTLHYTVNTLTCLVLLILVSLGEHITYVSVINILSYIIHCLHTWSSCYIVYKQLDTRLLTRESYVPIYIHTTSNQAYAINFLKIKGN